MLAPPRVRVGVRVRPSSSFAQGNLFLDQERGGVRLVLPPAPGGEVVNNAVREWSFTADAVLPNASQEDVYEQLVSEAVEGVLEGRSACVLAYGQTGSGKSFTMLGDGRAHRNRGVAPRALAQVMAGVAARPEAEFSVTISQCEVYMDAVHDLLARSAHVAGLAAPLLARFRLDVSGGGGGGEGLPVARAPGDALAADLSIIDDPLEGVRVRGLSQVPIASEEEALGALFAGERARVTASHALNRASSRGHSILTLTLRRRGAAGREAPSSAQLQLVDLAGSERLMRTASGALRAPARGGGGGGGGGSPRGLGAPAPLVGVPLTTRPAGGGGGMSLTSADEDLTYRESVAINRSLG